MGMYHLFWNSKIIGVLASRTLSNMARYQISVKLFDVLFPAYHAGYEWLYGEDIDREIILGYCTEEYQAGFVCQKLSNHASKKSKTYKASINRNIKIKQTLSFAQLIKFNIEEIEDRNDVSRHQYYYFNLKKMEDNVLYPINGNLKFAVPLDKIDDYLAGKYEEIESSGSEVDAYTEDPDSSDDETGPSYILSIASNIVSKITGSYVVCDLEKTDLMWVLDTNEVGEYEENEVAQHTHDDGWTIKAKVQSDNYSWIEEFEAWHRLHGKVWRDVEDVKNHTVKATSRDAFKLFTENHHFSTFNVGDI